MTVDETLPAVTSPDDLDERLGAVGVLVQSAASAAAQLRRDESFDGDRTARLIEVSHALHRAALALSDVDLIGHSNRHALDLRAAGVASLDSASLTYDDQPHTDDDAADRWRLLVDAVDEYAIFMLDPIGTVVTWNLGAQRIKGYTADEILGRHFSVFYTLDDIHSDKPQRHLAHAVEHHHGRDNGWRVRKDGTRFWANIVITALLDSDGRLTGFAKVTRDETDRNQAEQHAYRLQQLTDREELADDLSETIVHRIFEAGLNMQGALKHIADPVAARRIHHAVELLDDTIKEIRNVVLDRRRVTEL
jgi:PAS domain S-box-containing protein